MSEKQMRLGALEAGGTKMVCAVVSGDGEVLDRMETPTLAPAETVPQMIEWFAARDVDALGIGAFGPTCVDPADERYGSILQTPKLAWRGYGLRAAFADALGIPVAYDTDVNVACLGEAVFGCCKGLKDAVYVTIGTGVGAGVMCAGRLLHGMLHPGLRRRPRDPRRGRAGKQGARVTCALSAIQRVKKRRALLANWAARSARLLHLFLGQDAPPPLESLDRHTHEVWTGVDKERGADVGADNLHRVARIVFGAEPSDEEILQFVAGKWEKLSFFGGKPAEASKPAKSPKRRAREAAKTLKRPAMSTKAQQALAAQREVMKQESAHARSQRRVDANGDGYARARARHRTSQLVSQVFGTHTRRSKMRSDSAWLETEPRCPTSRPPAAPRCGRCRRQSGAFPRARSGRGMPGTRRQCAWCCHR